MTVTVEKSKAVGKVLAPPSKSVAHRALICGALTDKSVIKNLAMSKDVEATLSCLASLGAKVEFISNDELTVGGLDLHKVPDNTVLDCNESGSTLRFLIPIALLCGKKITFKGARRLISRPLTVYEEIAKQKGFLFEKSQNSITLCGKLTAGSYEVAGDISSQFITGLIFALSQVEGESEIKLTTELESAPYVDITLGVMAEFGVDVKREDNLFKIVGKQLEGREYTVEGDCSNAAFLDAFNLLGGEVEVIGLNPDTLQGDRVYKQFFRDLIKGKKEFDITDCPDLAPIMFSLSAVYGGNR
jgi:3-phosphoshikimate 1-carboxyvinyltransferase